jgi:bifunctional oligoribonuclease and PAP phosphatase NrnA
MMIPQFNREDLNAVKELLAKPSRIVITTHHKPDGDALGSSLALKHYLVQKGHTVTVVSPSEFPDFLAWMEGSNEVIDFIKSTRAANDAFAGAAIVFCLDFNDPRRVERMTNLLNSFSGIKILIDHHLDPQPFCNYTFSFPRSCATSELIYHFVVALGDKALLNQSVASCLYAGLITDTGSFRFDSVSADTHRVVAELLATGIHHNKIHDYIYDSYSESRLRFLGFCLKDKLVIHPEYHAAHIAISRVDMDTYKHQSGDLEGIVNFALSIKGIKMAALFSERDGVIKMSFRSKDDFSVKQLAEEHFEGGGHKNAAGGRSNLSLQDTVKKFEELLPLYSAKLSE